MTRRSPFIRSAARRHVTALLLCLWPGVALAQSDPPAPEVSERAQGTRRARAARQDSKDGRQSKQSGADREKSEARTRANDPREVGGTAGATQARDARRVRVRSSVTVIDPQADVGDIISQIRRHDRTGGNRAAANRGSHRRDAIRHAGARAGRAGRASGDKLEQHHQLEDRRKRRDARLERRGDVFRRRTEQRSRTREQHHERERR